MTEDLTPITLNANLVKRLAEAADSFRDGKYYYFLSKLAYPFDLKSTSGYSDPEDANTEADTLLAQLGTEYKKFGPFNTPSDDEPLIDYDSIQLRFMNGQTEVHSETLNKNTDAIVLTLSAYDKFFHTYYTRLYGAEAAADFRTAAGSATKARKPPTHVSGTRYKADTFEAG